MLQITASMQEELDKISTVEFNIFTVRKTTLENELVTVATYLLHQEQLFSSLNINMETWMRFITKIQSGYKDIAYHNKTHAADLA
jgi:hypothetical protein